IDCRHRYWHRRCVDRQLAAASPRHSLRSRDCPSDHWRHDRRHRLAFNPEIGVSARPVVIERIRDGCQQEKASRLDCCREERTKAALKKQDASKNYLQDNETHTWRAETEGSEVGHPTRPSPLLKKEVSPSPVSFFCRN